MERGRGALGPALELVHTGRAPTRAVLTAELGVTRATAGAVAAELEALGLIRVDSRPAAAGSQGRPSHRLSLDESGPVVLAAQIHADGFRAALVGLGGRTVATVPGRLTPTADPVQMVGAVVDAGAALLAESGRRCVGAGLAVPSAVAEPEGTARGPLHLAWPAGSPVRAVFAERVRAAGIDGPAFTGNDVNLAALAEHRHGAGRGARHLLCVATGHRGVGGALVLDGRLHTGSSGLALEVGHLTVNPEGRPCHCGSRGCLDVEADPLAFLTAAGRRPGPEGSLLQQSRELLRSEYGEPGVRAAAEELVDRLGLGLAGLVNILNPDRIVLGGLHRELLAAEPERLRAVVADRSLCGRGGEVPVLPSALDHSGLVGGAGLAWWSWSSTTFRNLLCFPRETPAPRFPPPDPKPVGTGRTGPGGAPRGTRVYPTAPRTRVGPAPDGACTGQLCTRWEGHGPGACPGLRMGQASTGLRRYGPGVHREGVHPAEPVRGMCAAGAYPAGSAPGRRPPRRGCARRGPHPAGPAPCRRAPGVRALMGQTPAWGRVYGPGAHLFPAGMCAVRVYLAGPAPGGRVPGGARTRQGMHRAGVHPAGRARARCLPGAAYGAGSSAAAGLACQSYSLIYLVDLPIPSLSVNLDGL
ncbi:ROK-family transcriptional regulator [Streptomyces clavuligerus]|nr:ROK-family transcriptional regulator [Streptomyces clavuligerus]